MGKIVTVVWQEGQKTRAIDCEIIEDDPQKPYIKVKTKHKQFKIYRNVLIKVEEFI